MAPAAGAAMLTVAGLVGAAIWSPASATVATRATAAVRTSGPAQPVGTASLSFDDGLIGQFLNARPILKAAHLTATFYIISDGLGWGTATNMSPTQVRQLVADGDEIGNHTRDHPDLTTLSPAQVTAEFADSQAAIRAQVGVTPTTCAYPYGASNATVRAIAAQYVTGCRGTDPGTSVAGRADRYDLVIYYVHTETTAAQIRAAVTAARASRSWIIFGFHGVGTVGSDDDVTTAQFRAQVQAVKQSGIAVETVARALATFGR